MNKFLILNFVALSIAFRGESFRSNLIHAKHSVSVQSSKIVENGDHKELLNQLIAASNQANPLELESLVYCAQYPTSLSKCTQGLVFSICSFQCLQPAPSSKVNIGRNNVSEP